MERILSLQLQLTANVCLFFYALAAGDSYYRAAVLEPVQFSDVTYSPTYVVKRNLELYETAVKTAAINEVDIIVFPECGLFPCEKVERKLLKTFVEDIPDPRLGYVNPCVQKEKFHNHPILSTLSCLAQEYRLYIVANTVDMKKCKLSEACDADGIDDCELKDTKCPDDGFYLYNTNIVFDRKGTLVTRYYKKHLYFEKTMNTPDFPQDATFTTDFGKFTTVICFDLIFKESVEDVEKPEVANLAYPTYWYDHIPFMFFATAYQQAWAITNKVNLLAANAHMPGTGTLGSGIFSATKGALIYTHNPDFRTKLLISNVPKSVEKENDIELNSKRFFLENGLVIEADGEEDRNFGTECTTDVLGEPRNTFNNYRCHPYSMDNYEFSKLDGKEDTKELCSNGFCCSLTYKADTMDENYYFAVAGKPLGFYNAFFYGVESCLLVRCETEGGKSCKHFILQSHTIFEKVEIKAKFSTKYIYPFALDSDVRLTNKTHWSFDRKTSIVYENLGKKSSLLFIGLHGRLYNEDKIVSS
ncbi:vascular non-inflammatory molecule 3-like [Argiope bruennichi]|uniref:vascular non-inflammatory molecule 3-like n=1 Tax=Argiope bruennichi TaxID=94029 RepID=UPI0024957CFB|nr:vascular non-inflammatory molecule 3-like [Argiope bruennichi]